jgi:hypothetical protein
MKHSLHLFLACIASGVLLSLTTHAQHFNLSASVGYSGITGDPRSKMDYAYGGGIGWSDSLCARWTYEAHVGYLRYSFTTRGEGVGSSETTQGMDALNAFALARWNTSTDLALPFLAIGAFGSRAFDAPRGLGEYQWGPDVGIGIAWDGGRLLIHYQQGLEAYHGRRSAVGLASLGIDVW